MKQPLKVCMVSDTHSLYDDRIYWKEALSLVNGGYNVSHIALSEISFAEISDKGIHLESVVKVKTGFRFGNTIFKPLLVVLNYRKLLRKLKDLNADIYHLHDLKLLLLVSFLKKLPQKPRVIYDAHEPYPDAFLYKAQYAWIKGGLRKFVAGIIKTFENNGASKTDYIITTEENVYERFLTINPNTAIIYNYCDLEADTENVIKDIDAIYCGGISRVRGAMEILQIARVSRDNNHPFRIALVGPVYEDSLETEMRDFIRNNKLEEQVILTGNIQYKEVINYYKRSKTGLILFQKNKLHETILPIKIFEYMTFGLPIIGTPIGHIKKYIDIHNCGIFADNSLEDTAKALLDLLKNKELLNRLSNNSREASRLYKWDYMQEKLLKIYQQLLDLPVKAQTNNSKA